VSRLLGDFPPLRQEQASLRYTPKVAPELGNLTFGGKP
jgi:hypothetical protein